MEVWEARLPLELSPLGSGGEIAGYLDLKFGRLGKDRKAVIDDSGCAALAARLLYQNRVVLRYRNRVVL
jgi:hypothetical protein